MSSPLLRSGLIACIAALALAANAGAQDAKPDLKLEGRYRAEGTNPDGGPYRSTVVIQQDGDTWLVRWFEREGPPAAVGIGIVRGDYLSVSYLAGRSLGVVVYHIEKGQQLQGEWTVLGADGDTWPETLSRVGISVANEPPDDEPGYARLPAFLAQGQR